MGVEDPTASPEEQNESPLNGPESWLDWWCAARWRALLTWVALSWLMMRFDNYWVRPVTIDWIASWPFPSAAGRWYFGEMWLWACTYSLMGWFQPILLRLSLVRTVVWIGILVLSVEVPKVGMSNGVMVSQGNAPWMINDFVSATLPGLALIGERSRPWMMIVAAALSVFVQWLSGSIAEWLGFQRGQLYYANLVISSLPYAAVLLYGTRRLLPSSPRLDSPSVSS